MQSRLFRFFISGEEKEIFPGSRLWKFALSGKNTEDFVLTIGDYFSAARQFLLKNDVALLKSGLESVFNAPVQTDQISKIVVFLEKHGALYHPLKIQVAVSESQTCSFVLNGAVSNPGLSLIGNEHDLISRLNQAYSKHYLPRVFGIDFIKTDNGRVGFFLGEWFDGYKEFHVTENQDRRQIVIWEADGSCHYILETDALDIYQEISRILTYYYDLETFEQIFPWHHAAGDFIVRQEGGSTHVRLITVRGYASLTEFADGEADKKVHILPSLMFFFLNLTLRMRLDRLNGTGKTVMLGEGVIKATIEGFLKGLDEKSTAYDFGDLRSVFIEFFWQFKLEQIIGIMENILESCHPESSEINLLEQHLESHCRILQSIFKNL
ncbi:hypothetical protein [Desulfobacula sp.]|uniref:hypothetical protein n=1 Tax=Desulfobacula sp. TaxID=2593537 RepID=UPI0025BB0A9C|nr:hypothetical protein [Desulfobacula sp.]MBC2705194.1 hypothetical protein [Desulfobacula sp.]